MYGFFYNENDLKLSDRYIIYQYDKQYIILWKLFLKMFETIVYKIYNIVIGAFVYERCFAWYRDFYFASIVVSMSIFTDICFDECLCIRVLEMFLSICIHFVDDVVFDSFVDFLFHNLCEIYEMCLILDVVKHDDYRYEINTSLS